MNRRDAATVVLALAIAVPPFIASAQPAAKLVRIGFLAPGSPGQGGASNQVIQRLNELGYVEGKNAVIERRFDDRMPERLPALAAELVLAKVDVIVAITNLCSFLPRRPRGRYRSWSGARTVRSRPAWWRAWRGRAATSRVSRVWRPRST